MSGRIPRSFIDELLARTDIVDLIDGFVPLRKAGKDFHALCPFHDEKTPSFTVSRDKQFFHCFGCHASGTAITFLMEFSNLGFVEAVEELASRAGVAVPREGGDAEPRSNFTELYELLELAIQFYRRQLKDHPQAGRAVDYLKSRGVSGEIAARFELGYAPPGWDSVLGELGKSDQARERLSRAGMILQREGGGHYDRFRDRIIFPIRDQRGRAIGFGGRVLDDTTPKYLNSPETPIFHKGRELYGLQQAKSAGAEHLFVVEGYMDVIALHQFGVQRAVATLGTAATRDHLERLFRATATIVFCFDGDDAGRRAAWRALETSLPLLREGRQVYFQFMPEGDDPDTFVRHAGRDRFEDRSSWVPLSDYLLGTLRQEVDLATREGRARLVDRAMPYIGRLADGALRRLLLEDVAKLAGTRSANLDPLLTVQSDPGTGIRRRRVPAGTQGRGNLTPVSRAVSLLLNRPQLAEVAGDGSELQGSPVQGADFLLELIQFIRANPGATCASILEHWRDSRFEARLRELASGPEGLESEQFDLEKEFVDALVRIRTEKRKQAVQELTRVKRISELSEEERHRLRTMTGGEARGPKE
ncbi:MAG TPA: DNA primase [Gammaproteobacteria bacterium]